MGGQRLGDSSSPRWAAMATAWARLSAPSFRITEAVWNLTVRSVMLSSPAICFPGNPCAIRRRTSRSRMLSGPAPRRRPDRSGEFGCDSGRQGCSASCDRPDGVGDLGDRRAFEQVSLCARPDRRHHPLVSVVRREDEHAGTRADGQHLRERLKAAEVRAAQDRAAPRPG